MKYFIAILIHFSLFSNLNWSHPVTLSNSMTDALDPQIVLDCNGNATAVWVENGVVVANMQPFNGEWGTPQAISETGSSSPKLDVDQDGNATAVWVQNAVIYTSTLSHGGSWSSPVALSGSSASAPNMAINNTGDIVIVWENNRVIEAQIKSKGNPWSGTTQISSTGSDSPYVVLNSKGNILAVWHNVVSGADRICSARTTIGTPWEAEEDLTPNTSHSHNYPKAAIAPDGTGYVLWYRYDINGIDYINVSVLTASAPVQGNWGPPSVLSSGGSMNPDRLSHKIMVDSQGNSIGIWTNSYDNSTINIESALAPSGNAWTRTTTFLAGNPYAYQIDAANNSVERLVFVSMFYDGIITSIQASETNFTGGFANIWSPSFVISTDIQNGYPKVASSSNSSQICATAIWNSFRNGKVIVQAASGASAITAPPTNLSLIQSSNDFGLFQDHVNTLTWDASVSPNLFGYAIYRNGIHYIDVDVTSSLLVIQHNQIQNEDVTYGIIAINNCGLQSQMATVSLFRGSDSIYFNRK